MWEIISAWTRAAAAREEEWVKDKAAEGWAAVEAGAWEEAAAVFSEREQVDDLVRV